MHIATQVPRPLKGQRQSTNYRDPPRTGHNTSGVKSLSWWWTKPPSRLTPQGPAARVTLVALVPFVPGEDATDAPG